jgi:hypothetical protein
MESKHEAQTGLSKVITVRPALLGLVIGSIIATGLTSVLATVAWSEPQTPCPLPGSKETAEDCPWASWSRDLEAGAKFEALSPGFAKILESFRKAPGPLSIWGETLNYDENIKSEIVPAKILEELTRRTGVPIPRTWKPGVTVVHAGVEHTFGYLFANKETPFGFKRARWVTDDIEVGFGLSRGGLGPVPAEGNLLANVSYFLASTLEALDGFRALPKFADSGISKELRSLPYAKLSSKRLEETFKLTSPRGGEGDFVLRTDLVPFPNVVAGKKNTHLLIYSVLNHATKRAQVFTAFPVEEGFAGRVFDPAQMGPSVPIRTRYNAWIPGLTDAAQPILGKRERARGH